MVDIHSHILHNVYDSPTSIHVSLQIAEQYVQYGFTHVISTPHFYPSEESVDDFLLKCDHLYYQLGRLMRKNRIYLNIIQGAEVMLCPELLKMDDIHRLCIDNTSHMLVELPWNQFPPWTKDVLFELALDGIVPIMAHPERNVEIYNNFGQFLKLVDSGMKTQINANSIFQPSLRKKIIRLLFKNNAVSYIATDCHQPDDRIQKFNKALRKLKRRYGKAQLERITERSMSLVQNRD